VPGQAELIACQARKRIVTPDELLRQAMTERCVAVVQRHEKLITQPADGVRNVRARHCHEQASTRGRRH
jgi:hypothetical protein